MGVVRARGRSQPTCQKSTTVSRTTASTPRLPNCCLPRLPSPRLLFATEHVETRHMCRGRVATHDSDASHVLWSGNQTCLRRITRFGSPGSSTGRQRSGPDMRPIVLQRPHMPQCRTPSARMGRNTTQDPLRDPTHEIMQQLPGARPNCRTHATRCAPDRPRPLADMMNLTRNCLVT